MATVTVTKRVGSTVGTVIATVTDPTNEVREVNFWITPLTTSPTPPTGPYPADVIRRPTPPNGVYERDVVLSVEYGMRVRVEAILDDGSPVAGNVVVDFDARSPTTAPVGATLVVQDQDSTGEATTLVFQGNVVSVANGLATFNLDSRYITNEVANIALSNYYTRGEGDARYAVLTGSPTFVGSVAAAQGAAVLGVDSQNGNAKLELGTSEVAGSIPYIDFHFGVGAAQDFNARLLNNANNAMTLSFAGAGTFNVQGTIQQNGTAVSLAGHLHDDRYALVGHLHDDRYSQTGHLHDGRYMQIGAAVADAQHSSNIPRYNSPGAFLGTLSMAGASVNQANSGNSGGVFLYDADRNNYWIAMRQTANYGTHGSVTADWATYLAMDATAGRGWIFRNQGAGTNVASISNTGTARFNGGVRTDDWLRNSNVGTGLYNEAAQTHWYAGSDGSVHLWNMTLAAGYAGGGIVARTAHTNGAPTYAVGWFYYDSSYIGILHSGRNWGIRISPTETRLYNNVVLEAGAAITGWLNFDSGGESHLAGAIRGIVWGNGGTSYGIYKGAAENVGGNYAKLHIAYHTGVKIGAQSMYGGVRFFNTETMTNEIFSVGRLDNHTRVHGDSKLILGPNTQYGRVLYLGGSLPENGNGASIYVSSGNLHLDCLNGYATYLNYFSMGTVVIGQGTLNTGYKLNVFGGGALIGGNVLGSDFVLT